MPNSKNALAEGRAIPASSAGPALWADASGFYLLPALLRTWAPVGQTPVIRRQLSYDHRSAISAISLTGELYLAVQDHAYRGPDVVEFLQSASGGLAELPGPHPADWRSYRVRIRRTGDLGRRANPPLPRGQSASGGLAQGAARRLRLEQLPGYAPELNPDEGVWRYLKRVELKNVVCADLEQLRREFWAAVERLLTKPEALRACIREVGYV